MPETPRVPLLLPLAAEGPAPVTELHPRATDAERPRTLVDQAVEAITEAAARGLILPGDRIIETDIAHSLGMSRVPVREALRLLESQGLVISEPYKGIRLMPVTRARLEQSLEVRVALETTAARAAIARGAHAGPGLQTLVDQIEALGVMASRHDAYGFALEDAAFHRALCHLSGNAVLCAMWETLARQLTILIGLSTFSVPMQEMLQQHATLVACFRTGDPAAMHRALDEHIRLQTAVLDLEQLIEQRRQARGAARLAG